ncbi:alpha/beta hydrolase family protein [Krasilnikovia cinnamomea]|uniref:Alpha/beta hydrolase family protein n=1 Tax=Krasilnikovia cinnamomea TaxID=349313 RepID=A0A4Q7ZF28_9ACTN|nr:alpha/beta hydrolase [Krasilnikovia cinnamomea]RZU49360.1 alpha/beta hydrolase family protein [Krasilnikovia cinnamomea]
MAFTMQTLLDADPGRIHIAAEAWLAMAGDLDDACEELIRGSRDLPDAWQLGPAAEAAQAANRDLLAEASNTEPPARRIGQALRTHADTVRGLQEMARQIAAEATGRGFVVDLAAGTVAAGTALASDSSGGQQIGQTISSYVQQLQSIIERAVDLDESTMNAIRVNLPNARTGFGTGRLQNVSRTDLEAQAKRSPAEVKGWWDSLTPLQQEQAILEFPYLVGSMNGVPVTDRDTANRSVLQREIDLSKQQLSPIDARLQYLQSMFDQGRIHEVYPDTSDPRTSMDVEMLKLGVQRSEIADKLHGMEAISSRLDDPDKPGAYLMGLSAAGDGRAIVAVGNPDTADNVVTFTPGTTSDVAGIATDLERTDRMAVDANQMDPGRKTSAVYWLDYDAPDAVTNAGSSDYADSGAPALREFQAGLRATHDGPPSHNTVLGHSYGSTVVGYAAREGLAANDIVFLGSPGVGWVEGADGFKVENQVTEPGGQVSWQKAGKEHVYASTSPLDAIDVTGIGDLKRFGVDPTNSAFGATTFTTDNKSWWNPVENHSNSYWEQGNPSRANIAKIVIGKGGQVS